MGTQLFQFKEIITVVFLAHKLLFQLSNGELGLVVFDMPWLFRFYLSL